MKFETINKEYFKKFTDRIINQRLKNELHKTKTIDKKIAEIVFGEDFISLNSDNLYIFDELKIIKEKAFANRNNIEYILLKNIFKNCPNLELVCTSSENICLKIYNKSLDYTNKQQVINENLKLYLDNPNSILNTYRYYPTQ